LTERKTPRTDPVSSLAFRDSKALRMWLKQNHAGVAEQWVRLYRKGTGKPSITWPELVDQLLCFGWIDGVRKSIDEESYVIRITPRRAGSTWSVVNLRRARELEAAGLMEPAGLRAWEQRDETKSRRYSFERENVSLGEAHEAEFRRNTKAWTFFQAQPPSYRRTATWWVMSAKKPETQLRRLRTLIADSANGQRIDLLRR
jgi:uncharacterized protein YdeI (YjbR/CyaY-like superfamily)